MTLDILNIMEAQLKLSSILNLEFKYRWIIVGLNLKSQDYIAPATQVLQTVGRLLYITPIY